MKNGKTPTYRAASYVDIDQILPLIHTVHGDDRDINVTKFIVAVDGNKVVGCARVKLLEDGTRDLASLAVDTEYRRYGIGSEIIKKLLATFSERPVYLMCFPQLEGFYRKNGFEKISGVDLPPILRTEYKKHTERTRQDVLCMVIK